ncbi:MAG TPA: dihydrofolate reductase family protein [Nocardioides sp.]|nr:dihydrofolate reductase family protein [Nocardioides sp.]
MQRVRIHNLGISLDGFGTGEGQSLESPFGHAGHRLMEWFFGTATFRAMTGQGEGLPGSEADEAFASRWGEGIGVEIMGANKFGPPDWQADDAWQGWWGDEPPFHTPVIVLTHRPRPSIEMAGGTTFHFRDASLEDALAEARELAGDLDVRIGGGVTVARDFLAAGLVDHLHVVVSPIVLGRGVRLWDGLEGLESSYTVTTERTPSGVTHVTFDR